MPLVLHLFSCRVTLETDHPVQSSGKKQSQQSSQDSSTRVIKAFQTGKAMCHCAPYVLCAQRDAGIYHEDLLFLLKQLQSSHFLSTSTLKTNKKIITVNAQSIQQLILLSLPNRLLKVLSEHAIEFQFVCVRGQYSLRGSLTVNCYLARSHQFSLSWFCVWLSASFRQTSDMCVKP